MFPEPPSSVLMPIPISTGFWPRVARARLKRVSSRIIATAARTARSSSSPRATGMPKAALSAELLGKSREAAHVGEKDSDHAAGAAEHIPPACHQLIGDSRVHVARHG